MNNTTPKIQELLSQEVTTFATCWYLKLKSGKEMGFTDFDQDLMVDKQVYHSASGFTPSSILNNSTLAIDNLEIEGILDNDFIAKQDIIDGKYDHAEIEIFLINYECIEAGKLHLKRGWFGEVIMQDNRFVVEVRGLTQALDKAIGNIYSPKCRAKFGDERCGINLNNYTFFGAITAVKNKVMFIDANRKEEEDFFRYGTLKMLEGANFGLIREIQSFQNGEIILATPLPHALQVTEKYEITAGCDKSVETCINRFNNVINFRGEPHVPGITKLIK